MQLYFRLFLVLFATIIPFVSSGQTDLVKRLLSRVHHSEKPETRLNAILRLSAEYQSIHRDTLSHYASVSAKLASTTGATRHKAMAALIRGRAYLQWGWTDSSIAVTQPFITDSAPADAPGREIYFNLHRIQAISYAGKSHFREALALLYKIIQEAEQLNDSSVLATNLNTIASIAIARENNGEALKQLDLAHRYSTGDSHLAAIYTNRAQVYLQINELDSADFYSLLALRLSRKVENLNTLASALRTRSKMHIHRNEFAEAEQLLKEMISIRKLTSGEAGIVDDQLLLVELYLQTNQAEKAVILCREGLKQPGLELTGESGSTPHSNLRLLYFEAMARAYKVMGDSLSYQQTLENIIMAKDEFYRANSARSIAELQVLYEVQKKENTIIRQQLDLTRKNLWFYGLSGLSAIIGLSAFLIIRNNHRKQRLRMIVMQEEEKRMAAAAVKEAEESERRRIAADLHDNLGAYAASIVSIVDLLKALYPNSNGDIFEELGKNAQSIVSQLSDTIWVLKKDVLPLTAISDRLKSFTQRIGRSYPEITIDITENIQTDHLLQPSQSYHLFQIIKDGINNALKHSSCNLVSISIEGTDHWRVMITDDGKGMAGTITNTEGGNGLSIMQERAQDCGCTIEWKPNYPTGTCVIIESVVRT